MKYIVLDVPSPIANQILSIRQHYRSWRVALPAEITIAGSSGIGVLCYPHEQAHEVFKIIDDVAQRVQPIITRFTAVARFPGTDIFYYVQQDPEPFVQLQNALLETTLAFEESPFPFTPHCTILDLQIPSPEAVQEIISLSVPTADIVLDTLSVYALDSRVAAGDKAGCHLLHRIELGHVE
jgi:2'-5' RNA ligase